MLVELLNRFFGGSREDTPPKPNVAVGVKEKDSKRDEKYSFDIEALKKQYGAEFKSGVCIEIELSELLEILPRERHRKDAYDKLVKFLADENQPLLGGEHYLTDRELSERLKISRRTLQDYRNNGILPYRQLGGKILYRESDIERVLQK